MNIEKLKEIRELVEQQIKEAEQPKHRDPTKGFEAGDLIKDKTTGVEQEVLRPFIFKPELWYILEFEDPILGRLRVLQEDEPLQMCGQDAFFWDSEAFIASQARTRSLVRKEDNPYYMPMESYNKWKTKQEQKPWKPQEGEWFIGTLGDVIKGISEDKSREFGVEFRTKESAEHTKEFHKFYHLLTQLAIELNPSKKVVKRYAPIFNDTKEKWSRTASTISIDAVFENLEAATKAIEIMNQEEWRLPE